VTEALPAATAPVVVFVTGNESRGDDALGPELAQRAGLADRPDVVLIVEQQLQIEHALELAGRRLAVFIDAGRGTPAPFELRRAEPSARYLHTTHALPPEAVLETARRLGTDLPEAWVLCVRGERFALGEGLSAAAERHLAAAGPALQRLLDSARPGELTAGGAAR
jgi:hydrogenase maturation protease